MERTSARALETTGRRRRLAAVLLVTAITGGAVAATAAPAHARSVECARIMTNIDNVNRQLDRLHDQWWDDEEQLAFSNFMLFSYLDDANALDC